MIQKVTFREGDVLTNQHMIVLQGIPGSGKSTWARKFVKNDPYKWVIVNRDSIRTMLGNYSLFTHEILVNKLERLLVKQSLHSGYSVIIDATNADIKSVRMWEEIAEEFESVFELKHIDISVNRAQLRNIKRKLLGGRYVKRRIIKAMDNKLKNCKNEFDNN